MCNNKCSCNFSVERTYHNDEEYDSCVLRIARDMAERLDTLNSRVLLHVMELERNCLVISKFNEEILIQ